MDINPYWTGPDGVAPAEKRYPDINDLGFVSDQEAVAVVGRDGTTLALSVPRTDSAMICSRLTDIHGGRFRVAPEDGIVPTEFRYLGSTNILEWTWDTPGGGVMVIDQFMPMGPWRHRTERSVSHPRPPRDDRARHMMMWRVTARHQPGTVAAVFAPRRDNGAETVDWETDPSDPYGAIARGRDGELDLRIVSTRPLGVIGQRAGVLVRTTLQPGETVYFTFSWATEDPPRTWEAGEAAFERTEAFWLEQLARASLPKVPERAAIGRALLALLGLVDAPNGGVLAAATTSLPAVPPGMLSREGGVAEPRTWDYRYAWLRSSAHVLRVLQLVGLVWDARNYIDWLLDVVNSGPLQNMYATDGARDVVETTLPHATGYRGARPVRIGNAASGHEQNDIFGPVLDTIAQAVLKDGDVLDEAVWLVVRQLVEKAARVWKEPDAGIWEGRGELNRYTSSAIMCWVACDRGAWLAEQYEERDTAAGWKAIAAEIKAYVLVHGLDENGALVQVLSGEDGVSPRSHALDASTLFAGPCGFLDPNNTEENHVPDGAVMPSDRAILVATVEAIERRLTVDGLVRRYDLDEAASDGIDTPEDAFVVCSSWLVQCQELLGEHDRAEALLARLLKLRSPLGLYAELTNGIGEHSGNFPFAWSLLGLIEAIMAVNAGREAEAAARTRG